MCEVSDETERDNDRAARRYAVEEAIRAAKRGEKWREGFAVKIAKRSPAERVCCG